ncbi:MAG TPA: double zinc ribbon domain-containing protein, partial [Phycisphaerae bacterium]|nr:double zinc ribbon domain-containing protein [Phycisphaerae bacterium]
MRKTDPRLMPRGDASFGKAVAFERWLHLAGRCVADLVLPRVCAACGKSVAGNDSELCGDCWRELSLSVGGSYCESCGVDRVSYLLSDGRCTDCRARKARLRLDGFARVGRYDGALRQLILSFKRRFVLDRLLGRLLSQAILGRFDPAEVDLWVPVPAHWRRRLTVGFHPTALLARASVSAWGGRVEPVLVTKRFVPPFHLREGMSASDRAEAIKGAFGVARGYQLKGRTVCVIDDVTTTGATLGEAKRALQAAG